MPLTVHVDREGRIAISRAGVVDPLVFEADINALLAESVSVPLILRKGANSSREVGFSTGFRGLSLSAGQQLTVSCPSETISSP